MRPPGETGPQAARGKNGKEMNSMAIYSFNVSNVSRSTGASTCATLAYISGEEITDERTGKIYNYAHKDRIESVSVFLPEAANAEYQDPEKLMNQIEKIEKSENARTGKKIIVALPREFDKTQRDEVLKDFIEKEITDRNFGCVVAVHNDLENHNPHAHILIPNRPFKNGEFDTIKTKKEYVLDQNGERIPEIDPKTGKQKLGARNAKIWKRKEVLQNPLDKKETLESFRTGWEISCNKWLDEIHQIDHRSYRERGIEKEGTVHEGYAARKREKSGLISDRCEMNREILRVRNEYETIEKEIEKSKEVEREIETACKELEEELKKEREQAAIRAQQEMLARQAAAKAAAEEKEKEERKQAAIRAQQEMLARQAAARAAAEEKEKEERRKEEERQAEIERIKKEKQEEDKRKMEDLNERFRKLVARNDAAKTGGISNTNRTVTTGESGAETGKRRTTESNLEALIRESRAVLDAGRNQERLSENDRRESAALRREHAEEIGTATANNEQRRREEEQRKAAERAKEEERATRAERANTKSRKERSKGQSR